MNSRVLPLGLLIAWAVLPCGPAGASEPELRSTISQYVDAFNEQAIDRVAAMWTENATHLDRETGERTEGRAAIRSDIAEVFDSQPGTRLSGSVERVKFITDSVAKIEGTTAISSPGQPPSEASFSAIAVKQDGKWLIDSIEETPLPMPETPYDALKELEWLIGRWVDESDGARVDTTIDWSPNRAFLVRSFVAQSDAGVEMEGTQVIGFDPRSKEIRSWTFNSDGSFGDGVWSRSGGDWLIKSSQTTADGLAASGTYVMSLEDDDTMRIQLIGHSIEGEPQPSSEAVVVARVAEATTTTAVGEDTPASSSGEGETVR